MWLCPTQSPHPRLCSAGTLSHRWDTGKCHISGMHPDSPVSLLGCVFSLECLHSVSFANSPRLGPLWGGQTPR